MRNLDLITFDTTNYEYLGVEDGIKMWETKQGDLLALYLFDKKPDIGASLDDLLELRKFYRSSVTKAGLAVIEIDTIEIDTVKVVKTIFKAPQQSRGMVYIGSLTIPFQDFSYVVKLQAEERGITGLRDTAIFHKMIESGKVIMKDNNDDVEVIGWMQDPYDSAFKAKIMMNLSELEEYDKLFPEHPLSRVRGIFPSVVKTLKIDGSLKESPVFKFNMKNPWWKVW